MQVWKWTPNKERVLADLFEGRLSKAKISEKYGISVHTIESWVAHPEFKKRLAEKRERMLETLDEMGTPYIRKEQRLMALAALAVSAREEYEQRPWLREYRPVLVKRPNEDPGAKPGSMQMVEDYIVTEHYNADAASAERAALADIAAELGARKNVTELTGKDGEALPGLVINLAPVDQQTQAKYMRRGTAKAGEDMPEGGESDGPAELSLP